MLPNDDENSPNYARSADAPAAGGYKVEDDSNLEESDLKRTFFGGEDANPDKPGYEAEGMGGQAFGEISETRSGDDLANPSRNAGYSNDYFKRTEPLQEHPENQNFKPKEQEGEPDMNEGKTEVPGYREEPDQQKVGGVEGEAPEQVTQEGTSDSDGDQQKVNQDESDTPGTAYYKPEDDKGTPDYGSNSPD
jgi:hypothetical protein